MGEEELWCVVTGGRGFAARHLVEMLIRYDMYSVRIVDLGPSIKLDPAEEKGILGEALRSGRAQYVSADLRDKSQVLKACDGADVVFHMAAPDSSINNHELHHSVNVKGTGNIIDACIELKIKRLIYTSSASVVFDGVHGIINGDESLPYPAKHNDSYSATKAEGEALIIKSNGRNGLLTCCIRPSSIFGPGDKLLVPSLVSAARAGKLKHVFLIGDGNNIYDFTYVENVAHAHICAERALASGGTVAERAAGEAFFITNREPMKFWEFVSLVVEGLGYYRPRIKVPVFLIMPIARLVEWTYMLLAPYGMKVPQFTPSRVRLLSCSRTFNCSKADDRLGYTPVVPLQEGLKRTIESYSHLRAVSQAKKDGPSKAFLCLGGGKVADILLWKDKKQTLATIIILISIYFNFVASGCTIITAVSKLLLVACVFLFTHGLLPKKIFGYTIEKIPGSYFHLTEEMSHQVALSVASSWNSLVHCLKSLCKGNDWLLFMKLLRVLLSTLPNCLWKWHLVEEVAQIDKKNEESNDDDYVYGVGFSLLIVSFLGAISVQNLFIIGLPFAFAAFLVYEKKEEEIDNLATKLFSFGCNLKSDAARKLLNSKKIQ